MLWRPHELLNARPLTERLRSTFGPRSVTVSPEDATDWALVMLLNGAAWVPVRAVCDRVGATVGAVAGAAGAVAALGGDFPPEVLGDAARGLADLGELTQLQQRVALQWNDVRQVGGDLRIVAKISKEN